ncbi:MAG: alpha/beta hydrolase [Pleurocapsa minor GSE-CHR-MK-17-07R]|jgi:fermentation-respiration switch protein FrsA (DUF1100 family)|nr:alpha/beta hydrolase [Pleurocapsa minor GSE-CHR-MK 17-07R]
MVIIAIIALIVVAIALLGRSTVERLKIAENVKPSTATFRPGMTRVEFDSVKPGINIVGNIYIPDNYKEGEKRAGLVVAPPATSVKEQSAHNYAERMRKLGYITLTFDPRGIGETKGIEGNANPSMVANDISSAVTYLSSLPQVDSKKIANLGICAQAASSAYESAHDPRIKAVGLVSPSLDGAELAGGTSFLTRWGVYLLGGVVRILYTLGINPRIPAFPETEAQLSNATPMQKGMAGFYAAGKVGSHPRWKNALSMTSFAGIASLHINDHAPKFDNIPVHVEAGKAAQSLEPAERFFKLLKGPAEKSMNKIEGSDHFDLYWKPEYVDQAVARLDSFYRKHL